MKTILIPGVCLLVGLGACSGGGGGGGQTVDMQTVEFSLSHIVQRRIHADMWGQTVLEAYKNSWRALSETPPPSNECVEVVSVDGDLNDGFVWVLRLTRCEDLAGVSRVTSGVVTFTGDPFDDGYSGSYTADLTVVWEPDPDGGRASEAAMLNTDAATISVSGVWKVSVNLEGFIEGTAQYSSGSILQRDELQ